MLRRKRHRQPRARAAPRPGTTRVVQFLRLVEHHPAPSRPGRIRALAIRPQGVSTRRGRGRFAVAGDDRVARAGDGRRGDVLVRRDEHVPRVVAKRRPVWIILRVPTRGSASRGRTRRGSASRGRTRRGSVRGRTRRGSAFADERVAEALSADERVAEALSADERVAEAPSRSSSTSRASTRRHRRFGAHSRRALNHCPATCRGHNTSVVADHPEGERERTRSRSSSLSSSSSSSSSSSPSPSRSAWSRARYAATMTVFPAPTGCASNPPRGSGGGGSAFAAAVAAATASPTPPPTASASAAPIARAVSWRPPRRPPAASPFDGSSPRRCSSPVGYIARPANTTGFAAASYTSSSYASTSADPRSTADIQRTVRV